MQTIQDRLGQIFSVVLKTSMVEGQSPNSRSRDKTRNTKGPGILARRVRPTGLAIRTKTYLHEKSIIQ